eukprot:RCo033077
MTEAFQDLFEDMKSSLKSNPRFASSPGKVFRPGLDTLQPLRDSEDGRQRCPVCGFLKKPSELLLHVNICADKQEEEKEKYEALASALDATMSSDDENSNQVPSSAALLRPTFEAGKAGKGMDEIPLQASERISHSSPPLRSPVQALQGTAVDAAHKAPQPPSPFQRNEGSQTSEGSSKTPASDVTQRAKAMQAELFTVCPICQEQVFKSALVHHRQKFHPGDVAVQASSSTSGGQSSPCPQAVSPPKQDREVQCGVCLDKYPIAQMYTLDCGLVGGKVSHRYCYDCLEGHLEAWLSSNP